MYDLSQQPQAGGLPAPHRLAAGADPGLLYDGRPLVPGGPYAHHQCSEQAAGTRVGQLPTWIWNPNQEEHLRAAWHGDAVRAKDLLDLHAGPITHACPAASLAVAQRGR